MVDFKLKILNYGGIFSESDIKLPDGYICETSYSSLGNDEVTGYLYVCEDNKVNDKYLKDGVNYNCCISKYPGYFVLFLDRCLITNLDEVINGGACKKCNIDELNALFDFDYWITRENFTGISFNELKEKYGSDVTKYEHIISYNKIIGFSGDSNHVKCLTILNESFISTDKVDEIFKHFVSYDTFDLLTDVFKDKIKWIKGEEINKKVQTRIDEILTLN